MQINPAITLPRIGQLLKVTTEATSEAVVSSGASSRFYVEPVAPEGYTLVGVVGYYVNTGADIRLSPYIVYFNDNSVFAEIQNNSSSAVTARVTFKILWVRTS